MTQKIKRITTSEAARLLNISKTRVLQLINAGVIPAERVGKQFVLKDKDVKAAKGRKHGRPRKNPVEAQISASVEIAPATASNQISRDAIINQLRARIKPNDPFGFD